MNSYVVRVGVRSLKRHWIPILAPDPSTAGPGMLSEMISEPPHGVRDTLRDN